MDREVDVKRVRVDHPSGPILSDQSTISSSVILPQSHHPTLPPPPPQQSGTPTVPAPVSAPVSAHIVSQPYSAPPTRNTQAITYPPPTRPSTTPLHAQPVGPPPSGSVVSFHPYGPVTQQPQRTNSQDLSASRPSSASGQPDPHRPEWPSSAMEPNGSAPRPHQQSQVYGHHGLETSLNGMPMSVSGPTIMGPYTVQTSVQAPVQPRVEHYPAGYPQTPVVANFGNQTPYGTSPPNYAMVGKPHRKSARAQQACNSCRLRKQKCDESRPCSWCKSENLPCEYKEVPPPKADKHIAQIMNSQKKQQEHIETLESQIQNFKEEIISAIRGVLPLTSAEALAHGADRVNLTTVTQLVVNKEDIANGTGGLETIASNVKVEPVDPVSNESPGSHHTGAHYLMNWPWIRSVFKEAGVEKEDYVAKQEESHGQFRLFFRGLSGDSHLPSIQQGTSPAASSDSNIVSSYPSPSDDSLYNSSYSEHVVEGDSLGGLNPNLSLRLDEFVVRKFHDSYMKHMWIIYPIFNARDLKSKVEHFIQRYAPEYEGISHSPYPSTTSHPQVGSKRKYSASESEQAYQSGKRPKRPIDHSVNNAIILLILAIGSLCEYDGFLMPEEISSSLPHFQSMVHGSPSHMIKHSPGQVSSASTNMPSPDFDMYRSGIGSRGSSIERVTQYHDKAKKKWNVDRIPGLAYWTLASQILGEWIGERSLPWLQANILAGLYWGQIGKVLKSHSHLKIAADVMNELMKKHEDKVMAMPVPSKIEPDVDKVTFEANKRDDHIELLLIIFWSIYQLEGDIRAELDHLSDSGLGKWLEDREDGRQVRWPSVIPGFIDNVATIELWQGLLMVNGLMEFFTAQFAIRKILNQAHTTIYGQDRSEKNNAAKEMWPWLCGWRNSGRNLLPWDDGDELPTDLGVTRLRAKFYGTAYITNRPFLYQALYSTEEELKMSGHLDENGELGWKYDELLHLQLMTETDKIDLGRGSRRCILAALHSTVAFDGLLQDERGEITKRPKLTNIQGTMAAQFSNMLVVANAYMEERTRPLVPEREFFHHLQRTIKLLQSLAPVSPVFKTNMEVLRKAQAKVTKKYQELNTGLLPPFEHSPRPSNVAMTAPGTPQYYEAPLSATTSFSAPR